MSRKNKLTSILLIFIGVLLIIYPVIGKFVSRYNQINIIEKYKDDVKKLEDEDNNVIKNNYNINVGEIVGYIEIEKIKVDLPIYEGTDEKILLKGVGHLEDTLLPNKNNSYHSILVAHTGITAHTFFDNLINLEIDDIFKIVILNEEFKYKICDIKTILPDETNKLNQIKSNSNKLVTLITCTPKYINTHRLLVTGEYIEN